MSLNICLLSFSGMPFPLNKTTQIPQDLTQFSPSLWRFLWSPSYHIYHIINICSPSNTSNIALTFHFHFQSICHLVWGDRYTACVIRVAFSRTSNSVWNIVDFQNWFLPSFLPLFLHIFIQQIIIKCLLFTRHYF